MYRNSEKYLIDGINNMPTGFLVCRADDSGELLYTNKELLRIASCVDETELRALAENSFWKLLCTRDLDDMRSKAGEQIVQHSDQHFDAISFRINTREGRLKYVEGSGRMIQDPREGELLYIYIGDAEARGRVSGNDELTGLPTMKEFIVRAGVLLNQGEQTQKDDMAVVFLNIENFKFYNMEHGYQKGNDFLRMVAGILREIFPEGLISRFSADHFTILTKDAGLGERITELNKRVVKRDSGQAKMTVRAGICRVLRGEANLTLACEYARFTCRSLKSDLRIYAYYSDKLEKQMLTHKYVVANLDRAIREGFIKVYYQPVVRTLSGALCGMEALARWDDPVYGLLSPAYFIEALEQSNQIHILDSYIIREVCRGLREKMEDAAQLVPVSVNLSRQDFLACDIFQVVENLMSVYSIPKDLLHIEITESMLISETEVIRTAINKFHQAGYQVWMDDFGSGYSSLNVLKDFDFDVLKIDMGFLRNFSERSRSIISSIVEMAKKIGIQLLAEGVETWEQFEFLKQIGCEKVQGFLFSKPLPYAESMQNCAERGAKTETRAWRKYYDDAGRVDLLSDMPIALVEDNGVHFHILLTNEKFMKTVEHAGLRNVSELDSVINAGSSMLARKFREFIARPVRSGKEETMIYANGGNYIQVRIKTVAQNEKQYIHLASIENITLNRQRNLENQLDTVLRDIFPTLDEVYLVNWEEDCWERLLVGNIGQGFSTGKKRYGLRQIWQNYAKSRIYVEDQQRFLEFMERKAIEEKLRSKGRDFLTDYFRVRDQHGNYEWKSFTLIYLERTGGRQMLCYNSYSALSDTSVFRLLAETAEGKRIDGAEKLRSAAFSERLTAGDLLEVMLQNQYFKLFWKDADRRFLGASPAFLRYYGLSLEELVGKRDEDMGWHIDDGPARDHEKVLLGEGRPVFDIPLHCISQGTMRNILATKVPVYHNGKIAGLFGFFMDAETEVERKAVLADLPSRDLITGLMNVRGANEALNSYYNQYRQKQEDFALIMLEIAEFQHTVNAYGRKISEKFLRQAADCIRSFVKTNGLIGRISEGRFVVFRRFDAVSAVEELRSQLCSSLQGIREIEGRACTVYLKSSIAYAHEVREQEEMMQLARNRL